MNKKLIFMAIMSFGCLCGFAQKAPKGKLLSYSHDKGYASSMNGSRVELSRKDGKGILEVCTAENVNQRQSRYAVEVGEDVFQQVADIIKDKKLYVIKKNKKNDKPVGALANTEGYSIQFEDRQVSFDFMDISPEQQDAFRELEAFVKEQSRKGLTADNLLKYDHSMEMIVLPPDTPDNYLYQLWTEDGKTMLKVNTYGKSPVVTVSQDVIGEVFQQFCDARLDEGDNIFTKERLHTDASVEKSEESVVFQFKNGSITASSTVLDRHGKAVDAIDACLQGAYDKVPVAFPEGKMTYCSCAYTNHGLPAGEISHSYYELIADEGTAPKVIYAENRVGSHEYQKTEYRATEQDASGLAAILREKNVFKFNGYHVESRMAGGTSYRIYMEFASGEKMEASWNNYDSPAFDAYHTILKYMEKLTNK